MKSLFSLALSLFLGGSVVSFAAPVSTAHEVQIGMGAHLKTSVSDKPEVVGSRLKKHQGAYDLRLFYQYTKADALYGNLLASFSGYQTTNETSGGVQVVKGARLFYQLRGAVGYTFSFGNKMELSPYVGLGSLSSKLNVKRSTALPTDVAFFQKKWLFAQLGLRALFPLSENLDFGLSLAALPMLSSPRVQGNMGEAFVGGSVSRRAKKKINVRAELPITYKLSMQSGLQLLPFFESQKIGNMQGNIGGKEINASLFSSDIIGACIQYIYKF